MKLTATTALAIGAVLLGITQEGRTLPLMRLFVGQNDVKKYAQNDVVREENVRQNESIVREQVLVKIRSVPRRRTKSTVDGATLVPASATVADVQVSVTPTAKSSTQAIETFTVAPVASETMVSEAPRETTAALDSIVRVQVETKSEAVVLEQPTATATLAIEKETSVSWETEESKEEEEESSDEEVEEKEEQVNTSNVSFEDQTVQEADGRQTLADELLDTNEEGVILIKPAEEENVSESEEEQESIRTGAHERSSSSSSLDTTDMSQEGSDVSVNGDEESISLEDSDAEEQDVEFIRSTEKTQEEKDQIVSSKDLEAALGRKEANEKIQEEKQKPQETRTWMEYLGLARKKPTGSMKYPEKIFVSDLLKDKDQQQAKALLEIIPSAVLQTAKDLRNPIFKQNIPPVAVLDEFSSFVQENNQEYIKATLDDWGAISLHVSAIENKRPFLALYILQEYYNYNGGEPLSREQ